MDVSRIQQGWDVYGIDGEKVGSVEETGPNYFVIRKGLIFHKDVYVPAFAVTNVGNQRVDLNIPKDQISEQGWDHPPIEDGNPAMNPADTDEDTSDYEMTEDQRAAAPQTQTEDRGTSAGAAPVSDPGTAPSGYRDVASESLASDSSEGEYVSTEGQDTAPPEVRASPGGAAYGATERTNTGAEENPPGPSSSANSTTQRPSPRSYTQSNSDKGFAESPAEKQIIEAAPRYIDDEGSGSSEVQERTSQEPSEEDEATSHAESEGRDKH